MQYMINLLRLLFNPYNRLANIALNNNKYLSIIKMDGDYVNDKFFHAFNYIIHIDSSNIFSPYRERKLMSPTSAPVNLGRFYLQKLLYIANIVSLVEKDELLIDERRFSPYENGPHIEHLTPYYKDYANWKNSVGFAKLDDTDMRIIKRVYEEYSDASYLDLYSFAHEDIGWKNAFINKPRNDKKNYYIDIRKYKKDYEREYSNFLD